MEFSNVTDGIFQGLENWELRLTQLSEDTIINKRNSQDRTIKQILGHMVDSASNNIHRIVHLQYQDSPLRFPNYATNGNNDRWIAIQNYQNENWSDLIQHWKYSHLHWIHIVKNVNQEKLDNVWISDSKYGNITLRAMIVDFLRHFNLHLSEIQQLIDK
ncbi:MAG TPA: hypothetical protein PLK12_00295 [Prolixibacteraceae bacterium]|nr:hypothetical protein [Prolixibacteraceae bacterium]